MKKKRAIRSAWLLCLALAALPAAAQNESATQRHIDSLRQVVEDLAVRVHALEGGRTAESRPPATTTDDTYWRHKARARYFNIGYVSERLTLPQDGGKLRSDVGASLSWGRTYHLHRKPLLGMIRIGLDWTWLDANWAKYDLSYGGWNGGWDGDRYDPDRYPNNGYPYEDDWGRLDAHKADLGMAVGPSVTVSPIGDLKINVYGRIVPSCALTVFDGDVNARYATYFSAGGAVSWKVISMGVEGRWGKIKNAFSDDEDDYDWGYHGNRDLKTRAGAMRLYLSFRF